MRQTMHILLLQISTLCFGVSHATGSKGGTVGLKKCSSSTEQVFEYVNQTIRNRVWLTNTTFVWQCLDGTCADTSKGCYPLSFVNCSNSLLGSTQPSLSWAYDKVSETFKNSANAAEACLDVYGGGVGPNVGIYRCDGIDSQKWTFVANQIQTRADLQLGARCLTHILPVPPYKGPFVLNRFDKSLERCHLMLLYCE